jgi:hypothetical protein
MVANIFLNHLVESVLFNIFINGMIKAGKHKRCVTLRLPFFIKFPSNATLYLHAHAPSSSYDNITILYRISTVN